MVESDNKEGLYGRDKKWIVSSIGFMSATTLQLSLLNKSAGASSTENTAFSSEKPYQNSLFDANNFIILDKDTGQEKKKIKPGEFIPVLKSQRKSAYLTNENNANVSTALIENNDLNGIYNDPSNINIPEINTNGIEFSTQIKANDGSTTSLGNGKSIINSKYEEKLKQIGYVKNTTATEKNINDVFILPGYDKNYELLAIQKPEVKANNLEKLKVSYAGAKGASEDFTETEFLKKYGSWSNCLSVRIEGILSANQKIEFSVNLSKPLYDESDFYDTSKVFQISVWDYDMRNNLSTVNNKARIAKTHSNNFDKYVAVYNNKETGTYTDAPEEVQKLMPAFNENDISYSNFDDNSNEEDQSFSGGTFTLQLKDITEALKDFGYTVKANKSGLFKQYSYNNAQGEANQSKNLKVEIHKVISAENKEIIQGIVSNFNYFEDVHGKSPVDGSDITQSLRVSGDTVNVNKPGTYNVTYTFNGTDYNTSKTVKVVVLASKAEIKTKDSQLIAGPKTKWDASDNFVSALNPAGEPLTLADLAISSTVDPHKSGMYSVTYGFIDASGNTINQEASVNILATKASIKVSDTTLIAGPDTLWDKADNFASAVDADGNNLNLSDLTVNGNVNTNKVGSYTVTYNYRDRLGNIISQDSTVSVVDSKTVINTLDSQLIAGPETKWTAADNFISAFDASGNKLRLSDLIVSGNVDTDREGTYVISYGYTDNHGNSINNNANISVVASKAEIDTRDTTLIAGPKTKWNPADSFISAKSADGSNLRLSDLTVEGTVDPNREGNFSVTYNYIDSHGNTISKTAIVTIVSSQAEINTNDTQLIAGPKTTWSAADNFINATDAKGQPLRLSNLSISGTVDTTKPGSYVLTYNYLDSQGNKISKVATVNVVASQARINTKSTTLIAGDTAKWNPADNFASATDAKGNDLKLSEISTSGKVSPTESGEYTVTYSYIDSQGNEIQKDATVSVVSTQAGIKTNNVTLTAGPKTRWDPADNFASATDAEGNSLKLSDLVVRGTVNTANAGTYLVSYGYTDSQGNSIAQEADVVITTSQAEIKTKDVSIIAGPNSIWNPNDTFVSAIDANGNSIKLSDLSISENIELTVPGTYVVSYSYIDSQGNNISTPANVEIIPTQANIETADLTLISGPKTTWDKADNFVSAIDAQGNSLTLNNLTIRGNVDPNTPGTYVVEYSYADSQGNMIKAAANIVVVASQAKIILSDTELISGPNTRWTISDNFVSATDAKGSLLTLGNLTVSGNVNTSRPGNYVVTYSYTDSQGNVISQFATVRIISSKVQIIVKNNVLIAGANTNWNPNDNFISAKNSNGDSLTLDDLTVSGNVDPTKAGNYTVTYSYTDTQGNVSSSTASVNVESTQAKIILTDTTLISGPDTIWDKSENFVSATDADGHLLQLEDLEVTGIVNPEKIGDYVVSYGYTDSQGNYISQSTSINVVPSKANIVTSDTRLIVGPNTRWTAADNFVSATNAKGNNLRLSDLNVVEDVDAANIGNYTVTYNYTDSQGNQISQTANVVVVVSQTKINTIDTELIAGPNTRWDAADNFDNAVDANGNILRLSDLNVSGDVDPRRIGTYAITYSYIDSQGNLISKTAKIHIVASKANIEVLNTDLIAGTNTRWDAADNFVSAVDDNGNSLKLSDLSIRGNVDTNRIGDYVITYSYADSKGNLTSKDATITVLASQAIISTKDTTINQGSEWKPADNLLLARDVYGNILNSDNLDVIGSVDVMHTGTYGITYSYTDAKNNTLNQIARITVSEPRAEIKVKDSTIVAGPTSEWKPADNFIEGVDLEGNAIELSTIEVIGNVDPTTPGTYKVTYGFTDKEGNIVSSLATITVEKSLAKINVRNTVLNQYSEWKPADNFVSGVSSDGKSLTINDLSVNDNVDTSEQGDYVAVYRHEDNKGNVIEKSASITVKETKSNELEKINNPVDPVNEKETIVQESDLKSEDQAQKTNDVVVNDFTEKEQAEKEESPETIIDVKDIIPEKIVSPQKQAIVKVKDSEILKDKKWNPEDNFISASDAKGNSLKLDDMSVISNVDTKEEGSYTATYSYIDNNDNVIGQVAHIKVIMSHAHIETRDITLVAGPQAKWSASDSFVSASDATGKSLDLNDITVDSDVNVNKIGGYEASYSYIDKYENVVGSISHIKVVPTQANIKLKDITLIKGIKTVWQASDNFVSASDAEGNTMSLDNIVVDSDVDSNNIGTYEVTYSFDDIQGNHISEKAHVTIVSSQAHIETKDTTLIAGPKTSWQASDNFVDAKDAEGKNLLLDNIQVNNDINTDKIGNYIAEFSYTDSQGNVISQQAHISIISTQASIKTKDITLIAGPNTQWNAEDNFLNAQNAVGENLDFSELKIQSNVKTDVPGSYEIEYSYLDDYGNNIVQLGHVTVLPAKAHIQIKDLILISGPKTSWNPIDSFVSASDAEGNALELSDLVIEDNVNISEHGNYTAKYSYTDSQGNNIAETAHIVVVPTQAAIIAKNSTIIMGPNASWSAEDNLVSATDAKDNILSISDLDIKNDILLSKAGEYHVTYKYMDSQENIVKENAEVSVVESKASIETKDKTIIMGPNASWSAQDNLVSASDAEGKPLTAEQLTIIEAVDINTTGRYPVNYKYTDIQGNSFSEIAIVNVDLSKANIKTKDSVVVMDTVEKWEANNNLISAQDAFGNDLTLNDLTVKDNVDPKKLGNYEVTYSYIDTSGNIIVELSHVNVLVSKADLKTVDTTLIMGPKANWVASDNLISATDVMGNSLNSTDLTVIGNVDISKPDIYEVKYVLKDNRLSQDIENTAKITVLKSQASIKTRNMTLIAGPDTSWNPANTFVSATDAEGIALKLADLKVDSDIDLKRAGNYQITYSYTDIQGNIISELAHLIVRESKADIQIKNLTLIAGPETNWWETQNLVGATDAQGNAIGIDSLSIDNNVNTNKPGIYEVTFRYTDSQGNIIVRTASVTVIPTKANIVAKDTTIISKNGVTWNETDNLISATDAKGNPLSIDDLVVNNNVNIDKPGSYEVIYSYKDYQGNYISSTAHVTVASFRSDHANISVKDSSIIQGSKWEPSDNLLSAIDVNGNELKANELLVDGEVNTDIPGKYRVSYSYIDPKGNVIGQLIFVNVIADETKKKSDEILSQVEKTSIAEPKDSEIIEDKAKKKDNEVIDTISKNDDSNSPTKTVESKNKSDNSEKQKVEASETINTLEDHGIVTKNPDIADATDSDQESITKKLDSVSDSRTKNKVTTKKEMGIGTLLALDYATKIYETFRRNRKNK